MSSIVDVPQPSLSSVSKSGVATLVNGTVTVSDANILPTSKITVTQQTPNGTLGAQYKAVAGTGSFVLTAISLGGALSALDNSTLQYHIDY